MSYHDAYASIGWARLRPGDPVRIDPPVRGYSEGVLAELNPYHAAVVTDDGLRRLVEPSRLSRLETSQFASGDGGISGWWLVPTFIVGGLAGLFFGGIFGGGLVVAATCDMSEVERNKLFAGCPPKPTTGGAPPQPAQS